MKNWKTLAMVIPDFWSSTTESAASSDSGKVRVLGRMTRLQLKNCRDWFGAVRTMIGERWRLTEMQSFIRETTNFETSTIILSLKTPDEEASMQVTEYRNHSNAVIKDDGVVTYVAMRYGNCKSVRCQGHHLKRKSRVKDRLRFQTREGQWVTRWRLENSTASHWEGLNERPLNIYQA